MAQSTPHLLRLSQELIDEVLQYLSLRERSLLSRTCKEAYSRVIEAVYQSIDFKWPYINACQTYLSKGPGGRIELLNRKLLEAPALAKHISTLKLDSKMHEMVVLRGFKSMTRMVDPMCSNVLASIPKSLPMHKWFDGEPAFRAALLLWLCTEVRHLYLGSSFVRQDGYLQYLAQSSSRYSRLESVTIGSRSNPWGYVNGRTWYRKRDKIDVKHCLEFLKLPTLQSFCMQTEKFPEEVDLTPLFDTSSSNLTSLCFSNSTISPSQLGSILKHLPSITKLEYVFQPEYVTKDRKQYEIEYDLTLDLTPIRSLLDPCKGRLTHLKLWCSFELCTQASTLVVNHDTDYLSFSDFPSLKSLQTSFLMLGGWIHKGNGSHNEGWLREESDRGEYQLRASVKEFALPFWQRLPANLQYLCLRGDESLGRDIEWLWSFEWVSFFTEAFQISGWRNLVPLLQRLHIEWNRNNGYHRRFQDDHHRILANLCETNGLALDLRANTGSL